MASVPVASSSATNGNPPPSALRAASARSRLPLAPRLTTTTSSRTTTLQRAASSGAHRRASSSQEVIGSGSGGAGAGGNDTSTDDAWQPYGGRADKSGTARLPHAQSQSAAKVEILAQFQAESDFRGDVIVRCGSHDFYVHRAILYFASPFFQSIFDGDWKETHLSVHTLSCSSSIVGAREGEEETAKEAFRDEDRLISPSYNDDEIQHDSGSDGEDYTAGPGNLSSRRASYYTAPVALERRQHRSSNSSERSGVSTPIIGNIVGSAEEVVNRVPISTEDSADWAQSFPANANRERSSELIQRLERMATPPLPDSRDEAHQIAAGDSQSPPFPAKVSKVEEPSKSLPDEEEAEHPGFPRRKGNLRDVKAIIDLSEEDPSTFQDVLCHIYPNLELQVTWLNTRSLFSFADKFGVPYLRRACTTFLRAALAGRPIEAMALSELYGLEDVYREASRHILDNMPAWDPDDLSLLSQETLLKLERKRTWFLERLLKLGLAQPARDYECHAKCADPQACANTLHERWHAQYAAAFKYGPPQPSIIWRHLRELETASGVSGASGTATLACQASCKAWAQNLFDRMYGLPSHQHTGRASQKFLAIKLTQQDMPHRPRARRGTTTDALRTMSNAR